MRTLLLGILIGAVMVAGLAAMPQTNKTRETISLGIDLTLGMSEDATIKKLAATGYSPRKIEPPAGLRRDRGITSMWIVECEKEPPIGALTFTLGKLAGVSKDLLPPDGNEVEFGRQLFFAMRDLELEGNSHCTIETLSGEVPEYSEKTANLRCGKKTIIILLHKSHKYAESVQLNEELNVR